MSDELSNVALLVSYDGRDYFGWQRHDGKPTIQGALEDAVLEAFGVRGAVKGSGRTDRGAHARGQVASVRLPGTLADDELAAALNRSLPPDIAIEAACRVPADFDALGSALGKTYRYVLWVDAPLPPELDRRVWTVRGPLDVGAMREALAHLVGEHDFATFATPAKFERASTVRTISRAELRADLPRIELTVAADGFLHKMVRNLVRAVVRVGEGRKRPTDIPRMLAACDRSAAPGSAPASGLYLESVRYDPPLFRETDRGPLLPGQ